MKSSWMLLFTQTQKKSSHDAFDWHTNAQTFPICSGCRSACDNRDKRNGAKHIFTCHFEASLISIMKFTMKFHVLAIAVFAIPAIFAEGKWLTIWYSFHSFHVAVDSITTFHSSGRRSFPTPLVSHVGWAFISSRPCSSGGFNLYTKSLSF